MFLAATAADLSPVAPELASQFQSVTGNRVRFVFGASGILTQQVNAGAPYDAILLANIGYIEDLQRSGKVLPETVTVYALGRLGIWSPEHLGWNDLASDSVRHIAIANPAHAPYGKAAKEALEKAGLWDRLQPKLVYGENVQQALQFAKSGNAEIVITAHSLIPDGDLVDPKLYSPIRQGAAVVKGAAHEATARAFLQFLGSPEGQAVLKKFGFDLPAPK